MKQTRTFLMIALVALTFFTSCEKGLFNNNNDEIDKPLNGSDQFVRGTWGVDSVGYGSFSYDDTDKYFDFRFGIKYVRNDTLYKNTLFLQYPGDDLPLNDTLKINDLGRVNTNLWGTLGTYQASYTESGWIYITHFAKTESEATWDPEARDAKGSFEVEYIDLNTNELTTIKGEFFLREDHGWESDEYFNL